MDSETAPACRAGRDGECNWAKCPQLRDGEPAGTGRHCPIDWRCHTCDGTPCMCGKEDRYLASLEVRRGQ